MREFVKGAAVVAAFLGVCVLSYSGSVEPAEPTETLHDCELVQLWEDEKQRGIEEHMRLGRPAFSVAEKEACRESGNG